MMVLSSASSEEYPTDYECQRHASANTLNSIPTARRASSSVILACLAVSFVAGVLATVLISGSTSTSSNESQGYLSTMLDSTDNNHEHTSLRRSSSASRVNWSVLSLIIRSTRSCSLSAQPAMNQM